MPTFEDLKSYLGDWLNVNTTRLPDSVRGILVNMAMRQLLRKYDLRFGEHSDTFQTADGTASYALPDRFSRHYTIWYQDTDDSAVRELKYYEKREFDKVFPDPTKTGKPGFFTVWGHEITLGRTPDRTLTVVRNYYRILPDLVDGSPNNTNDFVEDAWEAIFFKALTLSTLYTIEDARMQLWQAQAMEHESELVREYQRARSVIRGASQSRIPR